MVVLEIFEKERPSLKGWDGYSANASIISLFYSIQGWKDGMENLRWFFFDKHSIFLLNCVSKTSITNVETLFLNDFSHTGVSIKLGSSHADANK